MVMRRSGRMVRLARIGTGLIGIAMVDLLDEASVGHRGLVELLLGGYLVLAIGLTAATWNDWWRDVSVARIELAIDLLVGGVIVFATGGLASAFFVFGNIYVISALIRWGWRESIATAIAFVAIFATASWLAADLEHPFAPDPARLIARAGNMMMLVLLAAWVGSRRWPSSIVFGSVQEHDWPDGPVRRLIADVGQTLRTRDVAVIWSVDGVSAQISRADQAPRTVTDPGIVAAVRECETPQLFAIRSARAAMRDDQPFGSGVRRRALACHDALAAIGIDEGMAVPFCCDEASGIVVVSGVPGMCIDDLDLADGISQRACDVICGAEVHLRQSHALVIAANLETACNIHDSVIQSLSGTAFRLEALKSWIASGGDATREIDRLLVDLRSEQARARDFVGRLRSSDRNVAEADLCAVVRKAAERGSRTWGIVCPVVGWAKPIFAPAWLGDELGMLVTEAISNAVRHGGATEIVMTLAATDDWLSLEIEDNGRGFASIDHAAPAGGTPWTLNQRIQKLGGHLVFRKGERTRIEMTIPIGAAEE